MLTVSELVAQPMGQVMQEAGLINQGQVQVALMEQKIYTHLKFGEILALHGWVNQKTADFFAEELLHLVKKPKVTKIGRYFHQAGLLTNKDIQEILTEQFDLGIKFGFMAVLKGCIKQETLEFFLKYVVNGSRKVADDTLSHHLSSIDDDRTEVLDFESSSLLQTNGYHINDKTFFSVDTKAQFNKTIRNANTLINLKKTTLDDVKTIVMSKK